MHVLVIVNAVDAPAGRIAERIAARGWCAEEVLPHRPGAAALPPDASAHDALVVLGGAQDAWDDAGFPAFADELRLLRAFDAAGKPVLGICLGAQLMARAWGAAVRRMANGAFERGLEPMRRVAPEPLLDAAGAAPLLAYLRTSEKISGNTGKIVYNCLPPDEWGEMLPIRACFRHGYPQAIVARVTDRWQEFGFDAFEC